MKLTSGAKMNCFFLYRCFFILNHSSLFICQGIRPRQSGDPEYRPRLPRSSVC
jgi:hypothetical protein